MRVSETKATPVVPLTTTFANVAPKWDANVGVRPLARVLPLAPYIGQFARHGNKTGDRYGLGALCRVNSGSRCKPRRIGGQRFEALAQHFTPLTEGGGRDLLQCPPIAWLGQRARHEPYHGRSDF